MHPVVRCGVGRGADDKSAATEAFERSAVKWGVGRYLYDLDAMPATVSESGLPVTDPEMPQGCLPFYFRWCGRALAKELFGVIESACECAKLPRRTWRMSAAALLAKWGYEIDSKQLDRIMEGHRKEMIVHLHKWMNELAAGHKVCFHDPLYEVPQNVPVTFDVSSDAPEPKPESKPDSQKTNPKKPPATGLEFLQRLQEADAKLSDEKKIKSGSLRDHVFRSGQDRGFPEAFKDWKAAEIAAGLKIADEFMKALK
jgi:hypothetical protein